MRSWPLVHRLGDANGGGLGRMCGRAGACRCTCYGSTWAASDRPQCSTRNAWFWAHAPLALPNHDGDSAGANAYEYYTSVTRRIAGWLCLLLRQAMRCAGGRAARAHTQPHPCYRPKNCIVMACAAEPGCSRWGQRCTVCFVLLVV